MPAPADIDPSEIRPLLPSIIIAEYLGQPPRVRYRLVGTLQVYHNGADFTGRHLDEIDWGVENAFVRLVHDTLLGTAAPVVGHYQWGFRDSVFGFAEFGAFPLSEDGATVARSVGIDDFVPFELAARQALTRRRPLAQLLAWRSCVQVCGTMSPIAGRPPAVSALSHLDP